MSLETVVIGAEHFNTLGVIRSLGEAGIKPEVIIMKSKLDYSWVLSSKYISKGIVQQRDENEIINALKDFTRNSNGKKNLVPTSDVAVKVISSNHDVLSDNYILPEIQFSDFNLGDCLNKGFMAQKAQDAGLLVPVSQTVFVNESMVNRHEIPKVFSGLFPLIVKPIDSFDSKNKITVFDTESEWSEKIQQYVGSTVLIQQFIVKDEELGIQGVGFGKSAEPYIPAVVHKVRTSLNAMGSTTYAFLVSGGDEKIVSIVKNLVKNISYSGIFDVEVMRKGDDYYFIECNFRNGAYGYAYTRLGANLPMIWITGTLPEQQKLKQKLSLINAFSDFKHIDAGNVSALKWMKQFLTSDVHLTANAKDPKPFFDCILKKLHL